MAKSLLEKLNTLVRAGINDFTAEVGSRLPTLPTRSKDLDDEVEALRGRVDKALAYEEKLEAEIQAMEGQIIDLDRAADDAVVAGNEARARRLVQKMRRLQQRVAIMEADLNQHRDATAELISNVNFFDAMVGDLTRHEAQPAERQVEASRLEAPPVREAERELSDSLAAAERRLSRLEAPAKEVVEKPAETEEAPPPTEPKTIRVRVAGGDAPARPIPPAPAQAPAEPEPQLEQPQRYRIPVGMAAERARAEAVEESEADEKPALPEIERLTRALRKARQNIEEAEQKMESVGEIRSQIEEAAGAEIPEITGVEEPSPDEIDKDLADRRARLIRPDEPTGPEE